MLGTFLLLYYYQAIFDKKVSPEIQFKIESEGSIHTNKVSIDIFDHNLATQLVFSCLIIVINH